MSAPLPPSSADGTETCRLCLGSDRIAVGPWGVRPPKKQCPECHGARTLPADHQYHDPTI